MSDQHTRILKYMEMHKGGISPLECSDYLRITKLATRIGELIRKGYKITKVWEESISEDGTKSRYRRYYLEKS